MTKAKGKRNNKAKPRWAAFSMLPMALTALGALALLWSLIEPYRGAFSLPQFFEDCIVLAVAIAALRLLLLSKPGWTAACAAAAALLLLLGVYAGAFAPRAGLVAMIGLILYFAASLFGAAAGSGAGTLLLTAILLLAAFPLTAGNLFRPEETLSYAALLLGAGLVKPAMNRGRRWPLYGLPFCLLAAVALNAICFVPAAAVALLTTAAGVRQRRGVLCIGGAAALILAVGSLFLARRFAPFSAFALSRLHAADAIWMGGYAAATLRFMAAGALLSLLGRFKRIDEGDLMPLMSGLILGALLVFTGKAADMAVLPFFVPMAAEGTAHIFSRK